MDLQALKNKYDIIGNDPALGEALETAVKFAPTGLSVLIQGESGVGKENFARIIHQYSQRRQNAFFVVNCGALPKELVNSELFGHVKGSFTGAVETRKGYFEEADG
ncbi:MAG: sigma 54-interacting transcriptional regulator, partial [Bacteroidales bacterium]|nr:sigma 54-interacting transcriptional regulator [Bacteroidales bacterium]